MKRYTRICYYTDKADVVLAFLSSLLLVYIGLCYTGQLSKCFYEPYISSEYLAGGVLAINYIMLVGANPLRIFLAVFLLPARLIIVLLKPFLLALSLFSAAAAASAGADASRALKKKDKINAARHAKEMASFGALGAASVMGVNYSSGLVETRIRSLNKAYIRKTSSDESGDGRVSGNSPQSSNEECGEGGAQEPRSTKRKSVRLAGWLSFILPGVGQMYCGRIGRGLMYPLLFLVAIIVMAETSASTGIFLLVVIAFPVLSCLDARRMAKKYNEL